MTREERNALIERYAEGFAEVTRALDGFPPAALRQHPIPGKWSATEIVHHLADSETTSALRLRKLLVEDYPVIQGYDEARWAERLGYNTRDMAPALDAFRAARETTLQVVRTMTDADWSRVGWHSEAGVYGAEDWLRIYAEHAHKHAGQIRRLREQPPA